MSTTYNDLDLTTFPEAIDAQVVMQDPTQEQLVSILAYESLLREGKHNEAAALLEANPALKDMQITAKTMNRHEQMIIAIERMFKEDIDAYIKAAQSSVTGEIVNGVEKAKNDASSAVETASEALMAANEANGRVSNLKNVIRVVEQGGLGLLANGWIENGDLYVQELELDEMTTSRRMRYTLGTSSIGKLFIAGVTCETNGKVKVMSYNKPSALTSIIYCIEEVVA